MIVQRCIGGGIVRVDRRVRVDPILDESLECLLGRVLDDLSRHAVGLPVFHAHDSGFPNRAPPLQLRPLLLRHVLPLATKPSLIHLDRTPESLLRVQRLRKDAAPGIDGVRWEEYGAKLEERLLDLHRRVHRGAYRAPPVRRVNIPKPDGRTRPLGVAALEDKILQKVVVDELLTPIYEAEFLGLSYGFRPGRKAHDALDALAFGIERRKVNWIVDADIRTFFDAIDRDCLMQFVERRIGDRRVLRLLCKWLNAGVMEEGTWSDSGRGTPQGANVSPVMANVYLHYVRDQWFHRTWRPRVPKGEAILVRYADDFVAGFQRRADAKRMSRTLRRVGEAVETTARGSLGGREMVEPGPERLAQLFCGSGEYALAARFLLSAATAVAASLAPPVPTRPLQLGTVATDDGIALAIREDPSPVAGAAVPLAVHTQGRSRMP